MKADTFWVSLVRLCFQSLKKVKFGSPELILNKSSRSGVTLFFIIFNPSLTLPQLIELNWGWVWQKRKSRNLIFCCFDTIINTKVVANTRLLKEVVHACFMTKNDLFPHFFLVKTGPRQTKWSQSDDELKGSNQVL